MAGNSQLTADQPAFPPYYNDILVHITLNLMSYMMLYNWRLIVGILGRLVGQREKPLDWQ